MFSTTEGRGPRLERLRFLDGMRGVAALYVVLHHAALHVAEQDLGGVFAFARGAFRHGHYAVAVFIVLSGYSLMLPVAASPDGRLRGGFLGYLSRRAIRILPPYYAAIALTLALVAATPGLQTRRGSYWDEALPAFSLGGVASHLLMVHNLRSNWIYRINPPMWSVATEWQIYLGLPGLLAVWRRFGIGATVGMGFAVGYAALGLCAAWNLGPYRSMGGWFVGLFALGMAGAAIGCPEAVTGRLRAGRMPWGLLSAALGGSALVLIWSLRDDPLACHPWADAVVGAATMCLIVSCGLRARGGEGVGRGFALRLLESRWALGLGAISYSLYLVHFPLLSLADLGLRRLSCGPSARLALLLALAVPLAVAAARPFSLAFERWTLPPGWPAPRRALARVRP